MSLDSSLIRLKAYAGTLGGELANDLKTVIEWIEYTRPLLGAVSSGPDYQALARAGVPQGQQNLGQQNLGGYQQGLSSSTQQTMGAEQALGNLPSEPAAEEPKTAA